MKNARNGIETHFSHLLFLLSFCCCFFWSIEIYHNRQYCTQKIERLRHKLNLTQANKKKFKSVPLTVRNTRSFRHLYIPLFEAERAWSFAMQLKRESIEEPRKKRHLIRRLRRASAAAKKLEDICAAKEGKVDTRTLLEAQVCDTRRRREEKIHILFFILRHLFSFFLFNSIFENPNVINFFQSFLFPSVKLQKK